MIYIGNFMDPNLAKVGVEGSNPFARSSFPQGKSPKSDE